jgi:hypothetical protein
MRVPELITVLVGKLAQRFRVPAWTDERYAYYETELADLDPDILSRVVLNFCATDRAKDGDMEYTPTPTQLRQAVAMYRAKQDGFPYLDADGAWETALHWVATIGRYGQIPRRADPLVQRTIARIGGFQALCNMTNDNLPSHRKRFLDCYRLELQHELACAALRTGARPTRPKVQRTSMDAALSESLGRIPLGITDIARSVP